jgi:2-(1,2-epoxy-1,2-dihydrophenyl)acetyl-CoA isomerase
VDDLPTVYGTVVRGGSMEDARGVVVSVDGNVATIRLNDPPSMNALSSSMAADLDDAVARLSASPEVRCLVVTGTGRGFSAGGDVQSFYDHRDDPHEIMEEILDGLHGAVSRLLEAPFPTIAAINGVVAGAGMGLAMATDLAVAVDTAVFTMAYTGIGVSPDGSSTFFLPRLVGSRRAMEMILTNSRLSASEALELGLVNQVVAIDDFDAAVRSLAVKLAEGPTLAYVRARELVMQSFASDPRTQMASEAARIIAAGSTADFAEGVTAFIEKRPARFRGS